MKTLNEFNTERTAIQKLNKPHPNGIECPECGEELWDSIPMLTLTSIPPQKNIHCPICGYVGYRLA